MYCSRCGALVSDNARFCDKCGCRLATDSNTSPKDWLVCILLCFFLGYLGMHRFYVGKTGTGILQLLTCGGLGIWTIIDFVRILFGRFRDSEGRLVR